RSPAAGEMKLPRCQANETCTAARQTKPAPLSGERNPLKTACAAGTSPVRAADKKRPFAAANLTRQRFS
ncbi:hypothetical protein, partial [Pantoea septica]|uniref:hypothetical protein n=1 Tax=Pantoea septica TaxID=472695 RepID=UPI0028A0772C